MSLTDEDTSCSEDEGWFDSRSISSSVNNNVSHPKHNETEDTRRASYKANRKKYEMEKVKRQKHIEDIEIGQAIQSGILKIRSTFRSWDKFYCEIRPGIMTYFKDNEGVHEWQGSILLSGGQVIVRPSKKDGFVFKFFHPLKQDIHSKKIPSNAPLFRIDLFPSDHLIMRCDMTEIGQYWMASFEKAIHMPLENVDSNYSVSSYKITHGNDKSCRMSLEPPDYAPTRLSSFDESAKKFESPTLSESKSHMHVGHGVAESTSSSRHSLAQGMVAEKKESSDVPRVHLNLDDHQEGPSPSFELEERLLRAHAVILQNQQVVYQRLGAIEAWRKEMLEDRRVLVSRVESIDRDIKKDETILPIFASVIVILLALNIYLQLNPPVA